MTRGDSASNLINCWVKCVRCPGYELVGAMVAAGAIVVSLQVLGNRQTEHLHGWRIVDQSDKALRREWKC